MSYGSAAALQAAVYAQLTSAAALAGVLVVDAVPTGSGAGTFVLIGPEEVIDQADKTGGGAEHRLVVSVISDATGFAAAKAVAVAVSDALDDASLVLTRGRLVSLRFLRARAQRLDAGGARRIDLSFRARLED
ncbi:Protein of unknown function [Pseudorhodobacter antarcticus]|jgi:Ni,Fe-hydrogenase maturation factor|uniref:DUF3168 domain-containing protein n=1 Tax=Pseudorhodobacter antarcticus TaxID=1077947 RepID=A0A1H8D8G8_9RHOB|nr:DUF3168 domain-containing protein [Pseudorhodobacter antarcticus]SEN03651.1 Protein of unknown function [Pseudorhodobacter antarcticus]